MTKQDETTMRSKRSQFRCYSWKTRRIRHHHSSKSPRTSSLWYLSISSKFCVLLVDWYYYKYRREWPSIRFVDDDDEWRIQRRSFFSSISSVIISWKHFWILLLLLVSTIINGNIRYLYWSISSFVIPSHSNHDPLLCFKRRAAKCSTRDNLFCDYRKQDLLS